MLKTVWGKTATDSSIQFAIKIRANVADECRIVRCLFTVLLIMLSTVNFAGAEQQARRISFDIPQQRADLALTQFAEQADLTLIFPFDEVKEKTANRVVGLLSIEEAVNILLQGTGLKPTLSNQVVLNIATINEPDTEGKKEMIATKSKAGLGAFLAAVFSAGTVTSSAVNAQTANEHSRAVLEEIIVTAEKREASVQDTAISITAYSGELLQNLEIRELQSLSAQTPSMAFSRAGGEAQIYLRGVGNNTFGVGVDPSIALHLDGIYLGRAQMGLGQFMDMERVEVLRGPQGTLYGRNATGGTVNMVTRGPSADWEGYIRGYYGNFDRKQGEAAVGGPVSDTVGIRLAIRAIDDDGFTDDLVAAGGSDIDDQTSISGRGIIEFTPNEDFTLRVQADWTDFDSHNRTIRPLDNTGIAQTLGALPVGDLDETRNNIPSFLDYETGGITAKLEWMLTDNILLTSVTGYREFEDSFRFNTDGTELDVTETQFERDTDQISEEIRLSSVGLERWEWLVGYYYFNEEKEEALGLPNRKFANATLFTPNSFNLFAENETTAHAVFGQLAYDLNEQFKLTFGARYSYEKKDDLGASSFALNFDGLRNPANTANPTVRRTRTDSWNAFTPKVGLDFRYSDDVLFYFTASRGFKSGGTNSLSTGTTSFDPEIIWSYEGGMKSEWADGKVRFNVSAFYYDYSDLQVSTFINGTVRIDNAASAEIMGAEFDLTTLISEQLSWHLGLSLLDTEYQDFISAFGTNAGGPIVTNLSGNELINAPNLKLSTTLNYDYPLSSGAVFAFTGQLSYQSEVFFSKENESLMSQDGYALVDVRLAYVSANQKWEIAGIARNLFDKEYFQNTVRFTSMNDIALDPNNIGHPLAYPGEGRSFGVQAMYRF